VAHCTALHYTALHCTKAALHYTTLHCIALKLHAASSVPSPPPLPPTLCLFNCCCLTAALTLCAGGCVALPQLRL
jgi:hypothetical protein